VATKIDLVGQRVVSSEVADAFAEENQLQYFEVSAVGSLCLRGGGGLCSFADPVCLSKRPLFVSGYDLQLVCASCDLTRIAFLLPSLGRSPDLNLSVALQRDSHNVNEPFRVLADNFYQHYKETCDAMISAAS
jgi:hypothetical protein